MLRFITLTNIKVFINPSHISMIICKPNSYRIEMSNSYINGNMFFGSGYVSSFENSVEVCESKHPNDFKTITTWLSSNASTCA